MCLGTSMKRDALAATLISSGGRQSHLVKQQRDLPLGVQREAQDTMRLFLGTYGTWWHCEWAGARWAMVESG
jgi:hypothetical protein